jgi:uncharacterized OsmC-like protein
MTNTTTTQLNGVRIEQVLALARRVEAEPLVGATTWSASVAWRGAFRSESTVRGFAPIPSDEPGALGGDDTAPNPVEQLLAAFGNCLAVGYAANATAAGIEVRDLRIDLEGDLDLQTFLGLNPYGNAGYESIRVAVTIDSDATPDQLADLHERVVSTSPVGHTLLRSIPVDVRLA